MKFFHTADWHLGKLVQGVYMTEDQRYILEQLIEAIRVEKPDAVIVAGDIYDRAVPPIEAVHLFDDVVQQIVIDLQTPLLAIGGNHDSPTRLQFGNQLMKQHHFHLVGEFQRAIEPIILTDDAGEVHFHLVPYADPSIIRQLYEDDAIVDHHMAMKKVIDQLQATMTPSARHVFVGHAFVTPYGEAIDNTSDAERPLAIGGAEYVPASLFTPFQYTALGHLHQAHYVLNDTIRYAGSILKYSQSEQHHQKGFYIVEMDADGQVQVKKQLLYPRRDIRTVKGTLEEILQHPWNEDYVYIQLLDRYPVLFPMEKIRTVYPNAMHLERVLDPTIQTAIKPAEVERKSTNDVELFQHFYRELSCDDVDEELTKLFMEALQQAEEGTEC